MANFKGLLSNNLGLYVHQRKSVISAIIILYQCTDEQHMEIM